MRTVPIGFRNIGRPYDAETAQRYYVSGGNVLVELWGEIEEVKNLKSEIERLEEIASRQKAQIEYGASTDRELSDCLDIIQELKRAQQRHAVDLPSASLRANP